MTPIRVQIIPSLELQRMRLSELEGRTAVILEPIETVNGCWVRLDGPPYCEWSDWYIPYDSLMFMKGDRYISSIGIDNFKK